MLLQPFELLTPKVILTFPGEMDIKEDDFDPSFLIQIVALEYPVSSSASTILRFVEKVKILFSEPFFVRIRVVSIRHAVVVVVPYSDDLGVTV